MTWSLSNYQGGSYVPYNSNKVSMTLANNLEISTLKTFEEFIFLSVSTSFGTPYHLPLRIIVKDPPNTSFNSD